MAVSYVNYTGNGALTDYTFPFSYISTADVFVYVAGVSVPFTFISTSSVRITTPPANGAAIRIQRQTQSGSGAVNFTDGSNLLEQDLDLLSTRSIYVSEENADAVARAISLNLLGQFDAQSKRIVNVAAGTASTDAVNKEQMDAIAGSATAAAASAASALASLNDFKGRWYGPLAADPALDPLGNPVAEGDAYWNTISKITKVYNGSTWQASDINTANLAAPSGSSLVGFIQAGAGAVGRTEQDRLREIRSTPDHSSPQAAVSAVQTALGGSLLIPVGDNVLTAGVTHVGATDLVVSGQGYSVSKLSTSTAGVVPLTIGDAAADNGNVNIKLQDFGIVGAAGTGHGMHLKRLHNIHTHGLRIRNNGGDGVYADRCYAQTHYSLYSNNNTGAGFHAGPMVGVDGNDNTILHGGRFLANGTKGIHIEGSAPGLMLIGTDVEGNPTGIQIDATTDGQCEAVTILGAYLENQTGKNISIGEDAGATRFIWGLTMQGCIVNPGTVSAAANAVSIARTNGGVIANNHFSSANLTFGSDVSRMIVGPNKFSSATGPWGTTEPMRYFYSPTGTDFVHGWAPAGWNTRHRIGVTYDGAAFVMSMNAAMTAATVGTQDDATVGSSALELEANQGRLVRCAAGGGAAFDTVFSFDQFGLRLNMAKIDVIATASLPLAGADRDGRIIIEDAGAGNRNLIIYGGGERFRIDGGAAF